jgi:CHAD domain-containing protein
MAGGELRPEMSADTAASLVCLRLLERIEANLPGTLSGEDPESLHDFRVAVRRTRSLQRELHKVFPPHELKRFRKEFRRLQRVTGPTRDLDVYLLGFDEFAAELPEAQRPGLEVMRGLLETKLAAERLLMVEALQSERTRDVLSVWPVFLEELPGLPVGDRPRAAMPIGELAARRIDRVYGEMVAMGEAIDDASPHEALHDLRKKGKELRYLLEFFGPLFGRKVTKPMVKTLKSLQDMLGRFQDREVQAEMIRDLYEEVSARDGGYCAVAAMELLVVRLGEHQQEARAQFAERFAAFAAHEQRALVEQTFG